MSEENVEVVQFLIVDLDELPARVDPDIVWNPVEESSAQGLEARFGPARSVGRVNGTSTS